MDVDWIGSDVWWLPAACCAYAVAVRVCGLATRCWRVGLWPVGAWEAERATGPSGPLGTASGEPVRVGGRLAA